MVVAAIVKYCIVTGVFKYRTRTQRLYDRLKQATDCDDVTKEYCSTPFDVTSGDTLYN